MKLSRLEQIAQLFNVTLTELFTLNEKSTFIQAVNSTQTHCYIGSFSTEKFQIELDKQKLIIEFKDKEINMKNAEIQHLNKIVALLEKQDQ